MPDTTDYTWLVDRRSKVQELLLGLYELVKANRATIAQDDLQRGVFSLLVGAAFSLWRAAFLTDTQRDWLGVLLHAERFLELVVRDNAINYPQDRAALAWSVGYYLNSAYARLAATRARLEEVQASGAGMVTEPQARVVEAFEELRRTGHMG
ncbi:MAG: hypothetical protein ACREXS_02555, partial [Gammaproteobacteria bacterium]